MLTISYAGCFSLSQTILVQFMLKPCVAATSGPSHKTVAVNRACLIQNRELSEIFKTWETAITYINIIIITHCTFTIRQISILVSIQGGPKKTNTQFYF